MKSEHLEAFEFLAESLNFSAAASRLGLSQPALSRRIQALEQELSITLISRDTKNVQLTDAGHRLLRYTKQKKVFEMELLTDLAGRQEKSFSGILRIASYSAIVGPLIFPCLDPLLIDNPSLRVELLMGEVTTLHPLLSRSAVDYIISDTKFERSIIESHLLGYENFVAIEPARITPQNVIFFDVNAEDLVTEKFFSIQKKKLSYQRSFFPDTEAIIRAVAMGFGRAVVPLHCLGQNENIKVMDEYKSMRTPVYLHYHRQNYYSKLHEIFLAEILKKAKTVLDQLR